MKKFCLLLLSSSVFAVLPPLAQSTREIQTLLSDPQLYDLLGSAEIIQEIVKNDRGYTVVTQHYTLQVDIEYLHTGKIGPAQFKYLFNEPVWVIP